MREFSLNAPTFNAMQPHVMQHTRAAFGSKLRPCIVHCLRVPFDSFPLVVDEERGFLTSTSEVWPIYQAEVFHVGHLIVWSGRESQYSFHIHPGAAAIRQSGAPPKAVNMQVLDTPEGLIVFDDPRRKATMYLSPQEVIRDEWN